MPCPFSIPMKQDEVPIKRMDRQFVEMRESGSLAWTSFPFGGEGWVATGYNEVKAVLGDNRFSLFQQTKGDYPRSRIADVGAPAPPSFIVLDPPEHQRKRVTLMKHLTAQRVERLRPYTEELVNECLDEIEREGPGADFRALLIEKVPLLLLCRLLGAPAEDNHIYVRHAHNVSASRLASKEDAEHAYETVKTYFAELVRRKRDNPADDLLSALIHDTEVRGLWTQEELEGIGTILLLVGYDSTTAFLANSLNWLSYNPEVYRRLHDNPNDIPKAVEEFLRLLPVGVGGSRTRVAMEDIRVGDEVVQWDQGVLAIPHAANMDPTVFVDPDRFDMDRPNQDQHIAFGFGAHFCVGAQLARMDIDVVLRAIIKRFASLAPSEPDPAWEERQLVRGLRELRFAWEPAGR